MTSRLIFILLLSSFELFGQVTELSPLPEPVSNNAVSGAMAGGIPYVFSFSGIDSTKLWSGIHKKAFRYNVETDKWETIAPLPSGTGRIAAAASTVKNKIYIIGGYEVFADGSERSLNEVHVYDPETNSYLSDGKNIPVPIDDHVQAVWRDSLIYVVTGWSQNTNVPNVQIYNPTEDKWLTGTAVPNNTRYKVFGGSGAIVGDTLYYMGGARFGSNFPISNYLRKGYIDPNNPIDITWSETQQSDGAVYRSASIADNISVNWFGGSETTYNFDGIAYNNSGGVEPNGEIRKYSPSGGKIVRNTLNGEFPKVMDLRGIAALQLTGAKKQFIIAGGMEENQKVSNKTFLIEFSTVSVEKTAEKTLEIYPNPAFNYLNVKIRGRFNVTLFDLFGQKLKSKKAVDQVSFSLKNFSKGIYFLKITDDFGFERTERIIKTGQ